MLNLNERLKAARGYARRYQKDLAVRLKKSKASICNYEKGINEPSISELETIAEFFEVSAVWLVLGQGEMLQNDCVTFNTKPESQTSALEQLENQVRMYGIKNRFGRKQLRGVVLVAGVLLELPEDVTSDDEPTEITESRASELLEAWK